MTSRKPFPFFSKITDIAKSILKKLQKSSKIGKLELPKNITKEEKDKIRLQEMEKIHKKYNIKPIKLSPEEREELMYD